MAIYSRQSAFVLASLMCFALSINACAPSGFNGSTAITKKASAEATPEKPKKPVPVKPSGQNEPIEPSPTPTLDVPTDNFTPTKPNPCTDKGRTVAKLLTTGGITNNAANQLLEYELSMIDCEGVTTPITAQVILFDIDAEVDGDPQELKYTVLGQDGSLLSTGRLQTVNGSDLFGVVGPTRFHHRTNNQINVPASHRKIKLVIDLSHTDNQPMGSSMSGPVGRAVIDTFLRFGDATPVRMPVTFITNDPGVLTLTK